MKSKATTIKAYLAELTPERREAVQAVRAAMLKKLPKGYKEIVQSGAIGYVVPHSVYPPGYHCDPSQPLPFAGLASQKNHIGIYLMCVYADPEHEKWFKAAWLKSGNKLNMGKSCVRFTKIENVPLDVVTEAIRRVPVKKFIEFYERSVPAAAKRAGKATAKKAATKTVKKAAKKTVKKTVKKAVKKAVKKTLKSSAKKTTAKRRRAG